MRMVICLLVFLSAANAAEGAMKEFNNIFVDVPCGWTASETGFVVELKPDSRGSEVIISVSPKDESFNAEEAIRLQAKLERRLRGTSGATVSRLPGDQGWMLAMQKGGVRTEMTMRGTQDAESTIIVKAPDASTQRIVESIRYKSFMYPWPHSAFAYGELTQTETDAATAKRAYTGICHYGAPAFFPGLHITFLYFDDALPEKERAVTEIIRRHAALTGMPVEKAAGAYLARSEHAGRWRTQEAAERLEPEWGDRTADGVAGSLSQITCRFPLDFFNDKAFSLRSLTMEWAEILRPDQGYAGLLLTPCGDEPLALDILYLLYAPDGGFPGLNIHTPSSNIKGLQDGLRCVDWLTVISGRWIERLDGEERVRQGMAHLPVTAFSGGLILQAGDFPRSGDTHEEHYPHAYRAVAEVIEPIRKKNFPAAFVPSSRLFTVEETREWLARFSIPATGSGDPLPARPRN